MKKVVIICMLLIILAPTLASIAGFGEVTVITENRNKLKWPTCSEIREKGFQAVNNWYNDNFGLRDLLIRLQHQIDYSVFGYSKELFFGKGKPRYLFYRSVVAREQIANEALSEETQNEIVNHFVHIKNKLDEKGIVFKFIIAPQKNEILREESSNIPVSRPEKNMYYVMQDKFLDNGLESNYVNVIDELEQRNEKLPVYYYSDFHWNDWGAACAFGKVINQYANEEGMGNVYDPDCLEATTFSLGPNVAQLASLSVLYYDAPDEYTVNYPGEISIQAMSIDTPKIDVINNLGTSKFEKAALFIGDSYTPPALSSFNGTNAGIVALFPRVYFCHWSNSENILNNIPDDVGLVVIETIESYFYLLDEKLKPIY